MTITRRSLLMMRELGWEHLIAPEGWRYEFPATSLKDFVAGMKQRLNVRSMRVLGDPKLSVRRVATRWGYASLLPDLRTMMASADLDLIVIGETHERELVEYVQDQISAGLGKALVVVNHVVSEQAGMKYCAEWLRSFVSEVPVDLDCVNVQRNFLLSRITTVALGDVARTLQIALGDFTYHREQTT